MLQGAEDDIIHSFKGHMIPMEKDLTGLYMHDC